MLYDLFEDAEIIEASFAAYYGIRLSREADMTAREFFSLLSNMGADTPLGIICRIRGETDSRAIAGFNDAARGIYEAWRRRGEDANEANEDKAVCCALATAFG